MLLMECDGCGQQTDELYEYEGEQLCSDCVLKNFRKIDPEDYIKNHG